MAAFVATASLLAWFPSLLRSVSGTSQEKLPTNFHGTEEGAYEQLIGSAVKLAISNERVTSGLVVPEDPSK